MSDFASAISVEGLQKRFNQTVVIDDLSFEVQKNHIVGFLGPNGAGKTTTMRMLVGLSKPTSGQITVNNTPVKFGSNLGSASVGYLPEMPSLYGWMTGGEYLLMMANLYHLANPEGRVDKLLKMVGLFEAKSKRIVSFSGGMAQRLGIAQALVNEPDVLILDEPVSALDPIGRKEVFGILEGMRKDKTILFSTHILSDVDRICDDVVIINHGKLVVSSRLADLKSKYAQPILSVEFGDSPVNLLADIEKESWALKVESEGNKVRVWLNMEAGQNQNIPMQFFASRDIPVLHYGLNLPEIEDLFMKLLKGNENE